MNNQALIDALQVVAVLSSHLRRMLSEAAEEAVRIEAAVVRAVTIVKGGS